MLTGSSAINYEGQKQLTTPSIKVELREGLYGVSTLGISFPFITKAHHAVRYKNLFLIASGGARQDIALWRKDSTRYSLLSFSSDTAWGVNDVAVAGNTAVFFTAAWNSVPIAIKRHTSYGGTAWGASTMESVYTGASTMDIYSIAATSTNRIYFLEKAHDQGVSDTIPVSLMCSDKSTGSWITKRLQTKPMFIFQDTSVCRALVGCRVDNEDTLIVNCSGSSRGAVNIFKYSQVGGIPPTGTTISITDALDSQGLRVIKANGIGALGEFDIVDTNAKNTIWETNSFAYGDTWYYLHAIRNLVSFRATGGGTVVSFDTDTSFVSRSQDMISWSNFVRHLGDTMTSLIPLGESNMEYDLIGTSSIVGVRGGASSLDVSDNIVNYSNKDNERISLTLGNFK